MKLISPLFVFAVAAFAFVTASQAQDRASPNQKNVLFIAVDDLKPTLGCYGDTAAKTPNMDRLAKQGTAFDAAYCMQAVCAPSRNSLLTGLRQETLQIYDLSTNFRKRAPEVRTLPQWFKEQGYASHGIGKIFHVGHGNQEDPISWSVPHFSAKSIGYALPENQSKGSREEALFENKLGDVKKLPKGVAYESADVPDEAYGDGKIAQEAVSRLRKLKQDGQPFFLAVGFVKPHLPFCAPKRYWDMHDPALLPMPKHGTPPKDVPTFAPTTWGELRNYAAMPQDGPVDAALTQKLIHGYYAATSYMDAQLGKILDELDAQGLTESTIIVLWGDHGWHLGDHGMWCKHSTYEQATRAPLIISAPGKKGGAHNPSIVEFIDIYPTLCDLAGLPHPAHTEGQSLAPLLGNAEVQGRTSAFQVYPRNTPETGPLLGHALRTPHWRYVEWQKRRDGSVVSRELYDMQDDPNETVNIASRLEQADTVKELSVQLQERLSTPPPAGLKLLDLHSAAPKGNKPSRAAMFNGRDKDNDGQLTLTEFLADQPDPKKAPDRFKKFDLNQDGHLTQEEFINMGSAAKAKLKR